MAIREAFGVQPSRVPAKLEGEADPFVSGCICTRVCLRTRARTRTHARTQTDTHTHTHTHTYTHMNGRVPAEFAGEADPFVSLIDKGGQVGAVSFCFSCFL